MVRLLAARPSHAQRGAKVRDESFTEFDGIAGGKMRPLGAVEARQFGKIFEVNTGSSGALQQRIPRLTARSRFDLPTL